MVGCLLKAINNHMTRELFQDDKFLRAKCHRGSQAHEGISFPQPRREAIYEQNESFTSPGGRHRLEHGVPPLPLLRPGDERLQPLPPDLHLAEQGRVDRGHA